jgi:hypothetical protein
MSNCSTRRKRRRRPPSAPFPSATTWAYGDSNPNYYISEYTEDYMDENFVQRLVGATKSEFDAGGGTAASCPPWKRTRYRGRLFRQAILPPCSKASSVSCREIL